MEREQLVRSIMSSEKHVASTTPAKPTQTGEHVSNTWGTTNAGKHVGRREHNTKQSNTVAGLKM